MAGYYVVSLIIFLSMLFFTCSAKHHCNINSSCGDIIHISYPFRFKGQPKDCGDPLYELSCENNSTVLYLHNKKYQVMAIDWQRLTIRVIDPNVTKNKCSVLSLQHQSGDKFYPYNPLNSTIAFVSCKYLVDSEGYIDLRPCNISAHTIFKHSYAMVDASDVEYWCSVDKIGYMYSSNDLSCSGTSCSYLDIERLVSQGVELSWSKFYCQECGGNKCYFEHKDNRYIYYRRCAGADTPCDFNCLMVFLRDSLQDFTELLTDVRGYSYKIIQEDEGYSYEFIREGYWSRNAPSGHDVHLAYVVVVFTATKCVCGSPFLAAFLIYKWRRRHLSMYDNIEDFLQSQNNLLPIRYSSSQIKKMTKGFKHELGKGGYGSVYKGTLRSGRTVAVKVLGKSKKTNGQDFINEVATIGRIHHVNVVRLIGYCVNRSMRALIYDFMPNGSLEKYLFSRDQINDNIHVSYETMYNVSLGVARGIEYLHRGCEIQILHFDIKPHNILLDENFVPKLSDFGLAKLYPTENSIVTLTAARGTMGYMAPELFYKNIGEISYKADVYSFRMLLMEMAGRRKILNAYAENPSQIYFPSWAYEQIKNGNEIEMHEVTEDEKNLIKKMMIIALWCIQMKPSDRPSMHKVVEMLQADFQTIPIPPKPFLTPREAAEKND